MLFTDGLATVNERIPKIGGTRVFTLTSQVRNNSAFMQYLADQTGGKYINLLQTDAEKACDAVITHPGYPLNRRNGWVCRPVFRSAGRQDDYCRQLVGESGSVTLSTGEQVIEINADKANRGEVLARQWAGRHIQYLSILKGNQAEEILTLARKYGVVSPGTSLLVLENIEQYLEYGIEPPASRPALLAEYRERHQDMEKEIEDFSRQHLETVVSLWQKRIEWWEKEYKPAPPKPAPRRRLRKSTVSQSLNRDFQPISTRMWLIVVYVFRDQIHLMYLRVWNPPRFSVTTDEGSAGARDFVPQPQRSKTRLKAWSPDTPYLERIKTNPGDGYREYLRQRTEYAASPAFFFDCGAYFISLNQRETGLRVLSNLLEMDLEDVSLMRMYAWRLQQAGELDQAIEVFERILALRDDEPQSYRDLALALGDRWQHTAAGDDILRAMELLYAVVKKDWERFPEIEIIALMELNRLIRLAKTASVSIPEYIDPRLIKVLDLDIRISMSWDADLTDIDLHVFEPTGEHANYAHQLTAIGGLVSRDFTRGYGPEEYVLRRAVPGAYQIKAHYFGSHQQRLCGPCTVTVNVFTNYCRPDEQRQVMTLRLEESGADFLVGEVAIQGGSQPSSRKNLQSPGYTAPTTKGDVRQPDHEDDRSTP